jgi:hypothetical protein
MICWGVPRTLPSGPELSNTRLTMLPIVRGRFDFERERDLDDLMVLRCLPVPGRHVLGQKPRRHAPPDAGAITSS